MSAPPPASVSAPARAALTRIGAALAAIVSATLAAILTCPGPVDAARAPVGVTSGWNWPVTPPVKMLRPFDAPDGPYAAGHRGVDLAVRPGATIRSAGPGTVVVAGRVAGRPVVVLAHGDTRSTTELRTTYQPVEAVVPVGRQVVAGEVIGRLATWSGHCPASRCLHWGLRRGTDYLDPTALLAGRVRLLPVDRPLPIGESASPTTRSRSDRWPWWAATAAAGIDDGHGDDNTSGATPQADTKPQVPASALGATLAGLGGTVAVAAAAATRRFARRSVPRRSSP